MTTSNLPPADRLAEVRAQLKVLAEEENALKSLMISDSSARSGNNYRVEVKDVLTTRVDTKELRAMHKELDPIFDEYTFQVPVKRVEVFEIDQETGELIRPKRAVGK